MVFTAFVADAFSRRIGGMADRCHDAHGVAVGRPGDGPVDPGAGRSGRHRGGAPQRRREPVHLDPVLHPAARRGAVASIGTVGDSYDNAQAETLIGLYKAECCWPEGPWRGVADLELATSDWVSWFNTDRLHGALGHVPPEEYEQAWHAAQQNSPPAWWPGQDTAA